MEDDMRSGERFEDRRNPGNADPSVRLASLFKPAAGEVIDEAWVRRQSERWRQAVERIKDKPEFTTGEVAMLVHVAPRTVVNWFDAGRLGGVRRGRRRVVPREELFRFLEEHGMPNHWRIVPPGES